MKKKVIFCLLVLVVINVSGHEFWIQPDKFIYKRGETINIKFLVGENFSGNNWTGNQDKVSSLRLYFDDVMDRNLDDNLGIDKGDSLQIAMLDEGTVMVSLSTKNSFINLGPKEFNDYLREDGLADALEYRQKNGDTTKNGLEYFQRSVKTIFQVGGKTTNAYKQKTELPLDIIPAEHPYNVAKDGNFKVKVYFLGEKLKNTKVKVWHRLDDKVTQLDYTTDDDGEIKFFLSPEGEWMVSCVKMVRLQNDSQAEWQSYWSSLTWGYY
ncbi:MAG TPA: DUF4198 domain-containing protein [Chitinophagaceae bacterium]|jgi:uncharacterized GH25 family protein|nr:DUF4198 domain-containing protein [Chitinophagaceae bacterium]